MNLVIDVIDPRGWDEMMSSIRAVFFGQFDGVGFDMIDDAYLRTTRCDDIHVILYPCDAFIFGKGASVSTTSFGLLGNSIANGFITVVGHHGFGDLILKLPGHNGLLKSEFLN